MRQLIPFLCQKEGLTDGRYPPFDKKCSQNIDVVDFSQKARWHFFTVSMQGITSEIDA
jgi:hypothetical protein